MLPNRRRLPSRPGWSTATPGIAVNPGSSAGEHGELVFAGAAAEPRVGEVVGDLLQAQHVEIGDALRLGDDARRIDGEVHAAAPLHVPRHQLHRIPARMNDCTNCRWNSRNAISSGAGGQQRRRSDDRPVDALVGRREHLQAHCHRPRLDRVGDDERPEEIVPVVRHRHQRVREVGRARERHVDLPQRLQRRAAFDARGFVELARDGLERLAQQEDAERARHVGQADREDRVLQPERRHRPVVLDDQHVGHDHQLHEHQREQHVAAGELEARERVRGERDEHELRHQHHRDQDDRVEEIARERRRVPGLDEVVERERGGQREAASRTRADGTPSRTRTRAAAPTARRAPTQPNVSSARATRPVALVRRAVRGAHTWRLIGSASGARETTNCASATTPSSTSSTIVSAAAYAESQKRKPIS